MPKSVLWVSMRSGGLFPATPRLVKPVIIAVMAVKETSPGSGLPTSSSW